MKTKLAAEDLSAAEPWSVSSTCTVHQARCAGMEITTLPPKKKKKNKSVLSFTNNAGRNKSAGQTAATCEDDASAH